VCARPRLQAPRVGCTPSQCVLAQLSRRARHSDRFTRSDGPQLACAGTVARAGAQSTLVYPEEWPRRRIHPHAHVPDMSLHLRPLHTPLLRPRLRPARVHYGSHVVLEHGLSGLQPIFVPLPLRTLRTRIYASRPTAYAQNILHPIIVLFAPQDLWILESDIILEGVSAGPVALASKASRTVLVTHPGDPTRVRPHPHAVVAAPTSVFRPV
jgi:hypothetical protein